MRGNTGFKQYKLNKPSIDMTERVLSAFSYLTSGTVGFIWLVVIHIQGKQLSSFAKYNVFQSIFLSILIYIAGILLNICISVMQIIPFVGILVANIVYYLNQFPLLLGFSLIQFSIIAVFSYLAFCSFVGKYGRIPWVSDMVSQMR